MSKFSLLIYLLLNLNRYVSFKLQCLVFKSKGPALYFIISVLPNKTLHKIYLKTVMLYDYCHLIPKFIYLKNSYDININTSYFQFIAPVSENTVTQEVKIT